MVYCRRTPLAAVPRPTYEPHDARAASESTRFEMSESSDFHTITLSRGRGVRARARGSPAAWCRRSLGHTGARRTTSSASNSPLRAPFVHLLLFGGKDRFVAAALQRLFRRLLDFVCTMGTRRNVADRRACRGDVRKCPKRQTSIIVRSSWVAVRSCPKGHDNEGASDSHHGLGARLE